MINGSFSSFSKVFNSCIGETSCVHSSFQGQSAAGKNLLDSRVRYLYYDFPGLMLNWVPASRNILLFSLCFVLKYFSGIFVVIPLMTVIFKIDNRFCSFAPKCKVICERDTKSHARHIPFSVLAHVQRLTKDSHNTGNFMPCTFSNSVWAL